MSEMTTRERSTGMLEQREADRVPIIDRPWPATIERWRCESLPDTVGFVDFVGLDHTAGIGVDTSPRDPEKVIGEPDGEVIRRRRWAESMKKRTHAAGTPSFWDIAVTDPDSWPEARRACKPGKSASTGTTRHDLSWDGRVKEGGFKPPCGSASRSRISGSSARNGS